MRKIKATVGISGRHVHLCQETYDKLFDKELTKKYDLNQVGQFAANETVKIRTEKFTFDHVRIVGPIRNYDQVEISMTDARKLGFHPPVRKSGDLTDAEMIEISTDKGSVVVPACIIANRHIHMNPKEATQLGVKDGDIIKVEITGEKSGIIDAQAKVSDDGYFEVHLDTDDANAFLLDNNDVVEIIL